METNTTTTGVVPHINVIICTPGHSMMTTYVKSLLATISVLSEMGITWAWSSEFASHVGDAREITLNGDNRNDIKEQRPFKGQVTYDKLLWIDSDIAWKPEDFLKLYNSDKDIITGCYLLASGEVTVYKKILEPAYNIDEVKAWDNKVVEIEGAGFGFICVKQGVFESMTRPWFQSALGTWVNQETKESHTFPIMGEDLSWCRRALDLGYKLWVDSSVRVLHHKNMKLTWEGPMP